MLASPSSVVDGCPFISVAWLHEAANQVASDAVELNAHIMLGGLGAGLVEVEYQAAT